MLSFTITESTLKVRTIEKALHLVLILRFYFYFTWNSVSRLLLVLLFPIAQCLTCFIIGHKYNVINCGHRVVCCIPMTYFAIESCTFWCPFPVLPIFHLTSGNHQSVLCIHELGLLFVCFLDSTYAWDDNGIYLLLLIELET